MMSSGQGLDPRFMLCFPLQEGFLDKDTGLPLSGGIVTFYEQNSQTVLKPVYTLSGNGPFSDASYIELPNPMILSAIGTFVDDNGNDIVPYLFPYDGNPDTTTNTVDLYYITVYNSSGVFQFARQAWPNIAGSVTPGANEIENFIVNGQFLLHNNVPAWSGNGNIVNQLPAPTTQLNVPVPELGGTTNADVTPIAPGGWFFKVPHLVSGGSKNTITYTVNPISNNPDVTADPRYSINIACTSPNPAEGYKDLCVRFYDVNKFATNDTQPNYTFSFQGQISSGSGPVNVEIRLLKWFGTGGSPSTPTDIAFGSGSAIITSQQIYNIPGNFGTNSGMTLGTNNDDYVEIAIRFPTNQIFNVQLNDFILVSGNTVITGFPQTPNSSFLTGSTTGYLPTPDPNGFDYYLMPVYTPTGFVFDSSRIGKIYASIFTPSIGELYCDGSQYFTNGYSSDGIPYARLQKKLLAAGINNLPQFGTGKNFVTTYVNFGEATSFIYQNTFGTSSPVSVPADVNSGFTFSNITNGTASGFGGLASATGTNNFQFYNNSVGAVTAAADGAGGLATGWTFITHNNFSSIMKAYFNVSNITSAPTLSPGAYWTFSTPSTPYVVWYTINGAGTAPAVPGTKIQVNLLSVDSASDVNYKTLLALNGGYGYNMTAPAGSAMTGSTYWTFGTATSFFVVWYSVNGVGAPPIISNAINIPVAIMSTDTSDMVEMKTVVSINNTYFAVPDFRGLTLRGWDPNSTWDLDATSRASQYGIIPFGNAIGTTEIFNIQSHNHTTNPNWLGQLDDAPGTAGTTNVGTASSQATNYTGIGETRSVNTQVYWLIKY